MNMLRLLGVVGLFVAGVACGGNEPCDLEEIVVRAAGTSAKACGVGSLDGGDDVLDCLADAFAAEEVAWGVVQRTAIDNSLSATGWVLDGASVRIFQGAFVSCGPEGCRGVVRRVACDEPTLSSEAPARIVCGGFEDACGKVVCGQGVDCGTDDPDES